jgi:hypothetical protein
MRVDVLALTTAWQVDPPHEHIARIDRIAIARIGTSTAALAHIPGVVVAIAGVVTPARIEHRAPPSETPAFYVHAAAQQSCRYNLLRAPATNTTCSERSPVSGDLLLCTVAPSIAARLPVNSILRTPCSGSRVIASTRPRSASSPRYAFLRPPEPERAPSPSGGITRPCPDRATAEARRPPRAAPATPSGERRAS